MSELSERLVAASTWSKVISGSLNAPEWSNAGRVHDWRNHVPRIVKECWDQLNEDARAVAFLCAQEAADAEEWD